MRLIKQRLSVWWLLLFLLITFLSYQVYSSTNKSIIVNEWSLRANSTLKPWQEQEISHLLEQQRSERSYLINLSGLQKEINKLPWVSQNNLLFSNGDLKIIVRNLEVIAWCTCKNTKDSLLLKDEDKIFLKPYPTEDQLSFFRQELPRVIFETDDINGASKQVWRAHNSLQKYTMKIESYVVDPFLTLTVSVANKTTFNEEETESTKQSTKFVFGNSNEQLSNQLFRFARFYKSLSNRLSEVARADFRYEIVEAVAIKWN